MTVAAPAVCASMKMAAFTAQTKATMVMIAASSAAHHGLALKRRTRTKTSTANGTAISEMRSWPGKPTIWSISVGSSGVRMPETRPPTATMSRLLREVPVEADRLGQRALLFCATSRCLARHAAAIEGNRRGARRGRAANKSRANPKVDAAMAVLLPGGPTPNRLRREAHFVQCNVIVCI